MRGIPLLALVFVVLALAGCSPTGSAPSPAGESFAVESLTDCEPAFRAWVADAAALNSPDVDLVDAMTRQERIERRIFELCSLDQAERFNREIPIELSPGRTEPLIKPDFRTFAEVECVDESPLLDGTQLCAEVGK